MSGTITTGTAPSAPSRNAAAKAVQQGLSQQAARAASVRADWASRHPQKAREERALRKERAQLLERFSHKVNGTPETHAHAARTRQGAISRLYASGAIDAFELSAAQEIASVHERIAADVTVRTASLETRVDLSRHGDAFWESLGAVRREMAYSRWRTRLGADAAVVLAIIAEDIGISAAAARHHMHVRRARAILIDALQRWLRIHDDVRREVTEADLLAAHAGIL